MMNYIEKLDKWLSWFERGTILLLFSLLIMLSAIHIALENIFSYNLGPLFEMLPAIVLWITLMGVSYTVRERYYIKLQILSQQFSKRLKNFSNMARNFFSMLVMILLSVAGIVFILDDSRVFGKWSFVFAVFPAFFMTSAIHFCLKCARNIFCLFRKDCGQ